MTADAIISEPHRRPQVVGFAADATHWTWAILRPDGRLRSLGRRLTRTRVEQSPDELWSVFDDLEETYGPTVVAYREGMALPAGRPAARGLLALPPVRVVGALSSRKDAVEALTGAPGSPDCGYRELAAGWLGGDFPAGLEALDAAWAALDPLQPARRDRRGHLDVSWEGGDPSSDEVVEGLVTLFGGRELLDAFTLLDPPSANIRPRK